MNEEKLHTRTIRGMANDSTSGEITLAVFGSPKVGKSALTVRLLTKRFIGEYDSSTVSTYRGEIRNDGELLKYSILDYPGKLEDFNTTYLSSIDCCVIVYSIDDANSFNQALNIVQKIYQFKDPAEIVILLLGNKRDLVGSRKVSFEEARDMASTYNCVFYEVSAAEDFFNVHCVFKDLLVHVKKVKTIEKRNRKLSTKKKAARLFSFGGRARSGTL